MKKRIVSSLLALCMLLVIFPVAVFADVSSASEFAAALNQIAESTCSVDTATNTVTLLNDVTLTNTINITSGTVTLDLAGHTIAGKSGANNSGDPGETAISVSGTAAVTITDTVGEGKISGGTGAKNSSDGGTGGTGGTGLTVAGGTVTLMDGTIQGGTGGKSGEYGKDGNGGNGGTGLTVAGGTVTLMDGSFQGGEGGLTETLGNKGNGGNGGNALSVTGGTVALTDGIFKGGAGKGGGAKGGTGGCGLSVSEAGSVTLGGGAFTGGDGSWSIVLGGDGGNALAVLGGTVALSDGVFAGGNHGSRLQSDTGTDGTDGTAIITNSDGTLSIGASSTVKGSNTNNPPVDTDIVTENYTDYKYLAVIAPPPHTHCVCGGSEACLVGDHTSHSTSTYTAIPADFAGGSLSDNYYLDRDVTLTSSLTVARGTTLNLCLNGHKLSAGGGAFSVITVDWGATLNLCDCQADVQSAAEHWYLFDSSTNTFSLSDTKPAGFDAATAAKGSFKGGVITGSNKANLGGGVNNLGTLHFYSGTIAGNNTTAHGAGIFNDGQAFLYAPRLAGNAATNTPGYGTLGGGIYLRMNSTATMYGGSIEHNYATEGGGVALTQQGDGGDASFTLKGGRIFENAALHRGGGIYAGTNPYTNAHVTLNLSGGSITGNSIPSSDDEDDTGGGVFVGPDGDGIDGRTGKTNLNLSGAVTITGNTRGSVQNNLLLYGGKTAATVALTRGSAIGVSVNHAPAPGTSVNLTAATGADYSGYFTSDDATLTLENSGSGNAQIVRLKAAPAPTPTPVSTPISTPASTSSAPVEYTITTSAGNGGHFDTGTTVNVTAGGSAGFTITPDKGYVIANVNVDGKSIGAKSSYVFTNVTGNHTISATFVSRTATGSAAAGTATSGSTAPTASPAPQATEAPASSSVTSKPESSSTQPGAASDSQSASSQTSSAKQSGIAIPLVVGGICLLAILLILLLLFLRKKKDNGEEQTGNWNV